MILYCGGRLSKVPESVLTGLYVTTSVLGGLGNLAIILAIVTRKVLITTQNIFIGILALADILVVCFTLPSNLLDLTLFYWPSGPDLVMVQMTNILCIHSFLLCRKSFVS